MTSRIVGYNKLEAETDRLAAEVVADRWEAEVDRRKFIVNIMEAKAHTWAGVEMN